MLGITVTNYVKTIFRCIINISQEHVSVNVSGGGKGKRRAR